MRGGRVWPRLLAGAGIDLWLGRESLLFNLVENFYTPLVSVIHESRPMPLVTPVYPAVCLKRERQLEVWQAAVSLFSARVSVCGHACTC